MSEEKKDEILNREGELDEGELEDVAGGKGNSCSCVIAGGGEGGHNGSCVVIGVEKPHCIAFGEGKSPCFCAVSGNSGDWKP